MITHKLKEIKRASYFGLTLFSTIFSLATYSADYSERDDERRRDSKKHEYSAITLQIMEKHRLEKLKSGTPSERPKTNLLAESKAFLSKARELREAEEARNKKLQDAGKTGVKLAASGTKAAIESNVQDKEAKGLLLDLVDKTKEEFLSFFKK